MRSTQRVLLAAAWFLGMVWLLGYVSCGGITAGPNSTAVGAACTADSQCQQQCLVDDSRFPGGLCTIPCDSDADCPGGSVCIEHNSGVCAVVCRDDAGCAGFGRGFVCAADARSMGGDAMICRVL